jgi:hypothetical protein
MMKTIALVTLALYCVGPTPVFAQSSSVSTEEPKLSPNSPSVARKPKVGSPAKKQIVSPDVAQKPAANTIPMDFSGMAKRPIDLPYGNESGKATSSGGIVPGIGTNGSGGITPGFKMNF